MEESGGENSSTEVAVAVNSTTKLAAAFLALGVLGLAGYLIYRRLIA